jgi:cytochrome c-type biogenesis protein CcmH
MRVAPILLMSLCGALALVLPARAVEPGEILPDAAMETRARAISAQLRCLVCQNQSIDDSNAPLAKDLRVLVRERLQTGETDSAVMSYVVARYGDFVLLKPPFNMRTILLWLAPVLTLFGLAYALLRLSGRFDPPDTVVAVQPLSVGEEKQLKELLDRKSS